MLVEQALDWTPEIQSGKKCDAQVESARTNFLLAHSRFMSGIINGYTPAQRPRHFPCSVPRGVVLFNSSLPHGTRVALSLTR